jgi:hypothetical protein
MIGRKRPSTGIRDHKNPKPCIRAISNNCFCGIEQPCPSWKGIRYGPTAASGSTATGSEAAAPGAPGFEFEQCMQANTAEGFQGGDDAGTGTTHTLFTHMCMHPPPHTRTSAFTHLCTNLCAKMHTQQQAFVQKGTCIARAFTHVHTRSHTRMHVQTSACTQMYTHMHAPTHTYNHKRTRIFAHTQASKPHVSMRAHAYNYKYAHTHICAHVSMHMHTHT